MLSPLDGPGAYGHLSDGREPIRQQRFAICTELIPGMRRNASHTWPMPKSSSGSVSFGGRERKMKLTRVVA